MIGLALLTSMPKTAAQYLLELRTYFNTNVPYQLDSLNVFESVNQPVFPQVSYKKLFVFIHLMLRDGLLRLFI